MKTMTIYEPALCCETGLCGVSTDPELLRISTVLNTLKEKGIVIRRFNLSNAPMEFVKNNHVNEYVNEKGAEGLPCVTIDNEIVIKGRYPGNDEILRLLELPAETLLPEGATSCCKNENTQPQKGQSPDNTQADQKSCCCSGGNC